MAHGNARGGEGIRVRARVVAQRVKLHTLHESRRDASVRGVQ